MVFSIDTVAACFGIHLHFDEIIVFKCEYIITVLNLQGGQNTFSEITITDGIYRHRLFFLPASFP